MLKGAEAEFARKVDGMILGASGIQLRRLQEIDYRTQLDGATFYDAIVADGSRGMLRGSSVPSGRVAGRRI